MKPLSAAAMLDVWERERNRGSLQRAIGLLEAACARSAPDALRLLPVGERDALLLTLRAWAFGAEIRGLSDCPNCGEQVETTVELDHLRVNRPVTPEFTLTYHGRELKVRVPNTNDLLTILKVGTIEQARRALLERCIGGATVADLPEGQLATIEEHISEADQQADIEITLECPQCSRTWNVLFDIASFFWIEIDCWAKRTLADVHVLASSYGWSEAEILSLSATRRQGYLDMVRA